MVVGGFDLVFAIPALSWYRVIARAEVPAAALGQGRPALHSPATRSEPAQLTLIEYQMAYDSFLEIPSEEIEFVFRTNVIAMFHLCQAAVPRMAEGSTIINTTSIQPAQPSPELVHYAATKGAISTFTKGLAQELAQRGIRVNAVAPGPIWTPLVVMSFRGDKNAEFGEDTPLGRPGQPGELAPLYVFLATDDSRYISGEVIGATGGKPLH